MLFKKQNAGLNCAQHRKPLIFLPLALALILMLTACSMTKGGIVILEKPNGKEFTMEFKTWNAKNKCELSLKKNDVLQVEVARESGELALTIEGKNGSEPYTGNDLASGVFTVTVAETDEYVIWISGKDASGKIIVKNLESGIG